MTKVARHALLVLWITMGAQRGGVAQAARGFDSHAAPGWLHLTLATEGVPHQFAAVVSSDYGRADGLFAKGDVLRLQKLAIHLGYAVTARLHVGLGAETTAVSDSSFANGGTNVATIFDLQGLYRYHLPGRWSLGALARLEFPSLSSGLGLAGKGTSFAAQGLATWEAGEGTTVTFALGYLLNQRSHVAIPFNPLQRLVFDAGPTHQMLLGAGVETWFAEESMVRWGLFTEVFSHVAFDVPGGDNPITLGLGGRLSPAALPGFTLTLGCNSDLSGSPALNSTFAGALPWTAFANLAWALEPTANPVAQASAAPPATPVAAPQPPVDSNVVAQAAPKAAPIACPKPASDTRVIVTGFIVAEQSKVTPTAVVKFANHPDVLFTTNPEQGYFRTPPLTCDANGRLELTINSEHMQSQHRTLTCATYDRSPLIVQLQRGAVVQQSAASFDIKTSKGQVIDGAWIRITGPKNLNFAVGDGGHVDVELPPGRYLALIRATGYLRQTRTFVLQKSEHLVFDIAMDARRARVPRAPARKSAP